MRLTLLMAALLMCGCGGPAQTPATEPAEAELLEVYEMFRIRQSEAGKPPESLRDLNKYAPGMDIGFGALQEGRIVAVWGVGPDPASEQLLGYEKAALQQGGWVARRDGRVEKLTAEAAKAALAP